jgi:lauroyl/myristoyl acyltransferase
MFSLTMDWLVVWMVRCVVGALQALPLERVARAGRAGGRLAWWLDGRHRRVALENLGRCFGSELSPGAIRDLARENFLRIGENFACAVKTAAMTEAELRGVIEVRGLERLGLSGRGEERSNRVVAIGHFGNFELYARVSDRLPGYRFATTYRALRSQVLDGIWQSLRRRSSCLYFERRTEGGALRAEMNRGGLMLGLLSDQHAGRNGVWGSFLGQECSTTAAPAVLALRYGCPLHTAVCYRAGLCRWVIELGEEVRTREADGRARSVEEITRELNAVFEGAVRRDPANWFWVHRRWKARARPAGGGVG